MKTPREILFERHHAAEPKLDAIRKVAVAAIGERRGAQAMESAAVTDRRYRLREFLFSLRWHFAGMGAVWVVVVVLQVGGGHASGAAAAIPRQRIPSPQMIMASLRESRRQLLEMIQPFESRDAEQAKPYLPRPRSEGRYETFTA